MQFMDQIARKSERESKDGASTDDAANVRMSRRPRTIQQTHALVVVSCYTRFDNLAHGPKGTEARNSLYTFMMDVEDGQMVLLSVSQEPVMNPAFSRFHPVKNVLYTVTESVAESGEVVSWSLNDETGTLTKLSSFSAGGTSTCYITVDKECQNCLVVNYWDATIGVFALSEETGELVSHRSTVDPKGGKAMVARHDKHVNHSLNDASSQQERQSDPHSHAVILDPFFGRIAYVPDLGMDIIRQFRYDQAEGTLHPAGVLPSGPEGRRALGPRYIEFHPWMPVAYVVNELSSEVSVFGFDRAAAQALIDGDGREPTLRLLQTVSTLPDGFPGRLNTCGRVHVHASGNYVLVSNRGHDSIAVFRVHHAAGMQGMLSVVSIQHTRGATPRHFSFDASGQWLIAANQDSDNIGIFHFNLATGKLDWTGNKYYVPSPNFVCAVCPAGTPRQVDVSAPMSKAPVSRL